MTKPNLDDFSGHDVVPARRRGCRASSSIASDDASRFCASSGVRTSSRSSRMLESAAVASGDSRKASRLGIVALIFSIIVLMVVGIGLWWFNLWPFAGRAYTMAELGLEMKPSAVDFDEDGVDDYADLLAGARKDAENHPRYDGSYVQGGYPAEEVGVCTDVIWRAFREAGYDLKAMVDADIAARQGEYGIEVPDPNIDFRRVKNLETFLEKYAVKLANDWQEDLEAWQPGDIVVFDNGGHIGLVSDRRTREGRPYIIHNAGQPMREEDYLKRGNVTGHYRFDASKIDTKVLKKWGEE